MFKFTLKDMLIKKLKLIFVALSIIISAGVALLSFNVASQVEDGIISGASYYDMIIGPAGSSTQLTMNTLFFTDTPLGTIEYSYVEELKTSNQTNAVIPFSMGDSYNNSKIIGTTPEYLNEKTLKNGEMFKEDEIYTCVIGSKVASNNNLKLGDKIITSHGLSGVGSEHASSPLTVVGILKKDDSCFDNAVFTSYKTIWEIHEHEEDEEEEEESHVEEGSVCAILVKTKSFNDYNSLSNYYSENSKLLVVNPSTILREVLSNVDLSEKIVYALSAIILIMNIFIICLITMMNMYDSKEDIKLMRLIGISNKKISLMYLIENALVGVLSSLIALGLSKIILLLMSNFVSSMGIILKASKIYPFEYLIMLVIIIISILPTLISTIVLNKKNNVI